jgi:hypothetical protein
MRLLANDLGPAKIVFYAIPSREVFLDQLALRPDICAILNYSHSTLFQVQFVSRVMTLNNRSSDFLAERIKRMRPPFVSPLGSAKRFVTL